MPAEPDPLVRALHSEGPLALLADPLNLFGRFIGAWDLVWHGQDPAGIPIEVRGKLDFGWILGGRAIQDVWQMPSDPADAGRMRAFHGTTIRFFDPAIGAWRSTWLDPLNGRVRRFLGRPVGEAIVLEGLDDDPRERWSFHDITTESFRWLGEESLDGGGSWVLRQEIWGRRRT
jgi:hypothetical protein